MIAMMIGFGPGSLKTRCSKDGAAGLGRSRGLRSWRCMAAIPPPRPLVRGLSMYEYSAGVVWFNAR